MKKAKQRHIALGAVRSQLRRMGVSIDPFVPFKDVLAVLDGLNRAEPELIVSKWYAQATYYQIKLLRREWKEVVQLVYERTLWQSFPSKANFERRN